MSAESLAIAFNHSRATGTARCVLYGIANHDGDGGSWPSIGRLSIYAGGITRRNVQKALDRLEELGEIRRGHQLGGTERTPDHLRPNLYYFTLRCPEHCDRTSKHLDRRKPLIGLEKLSTRVSVATPPVIHTGVGSDTGGVSVATPELSINELQDLRDNDQYLDARASATCVAGHDLVEGRCVYACDAERQARDAEYEAAAR